MVEFKLKKIKKPLHLNKEAQTSIETHEALPHAQKKQRTINISLVISLTVILILVVAIVKVFFAMDFTAVLKSAGTELQKDKDGYTNFLLLGTGNENHDGADLTDTIIVVSLNESKGTVSMISIPRDLHVRDPKTNTVRINEIYVTAKKIYGNDKDGLLHLKDVVGNLTGVDLQYYVKVNFKGFEEIIDALGGIDVNVTEDIYDPFYPKGETDKYEIFSIKKGPQHLDGATALKYARSRKTSSDFARASRQQDIIYALKEKALKTGILLSQSKISELLNIVKSNLQTNLTVGEMLTLGADAKDLDREKLISKVLNDNPYACGGFLYPPPMAEFGGASVFLPAMKDLSEIQKFVSIVRKYPEALKENQKLAVLNGTREGGVAGETKQVLQRYCLDIERFGNGRSKEIAQTTIFYSDIPLPKENPEDETVYITPKTIDLLKDLLPQAIFSKEIPSQFTEQGYTKSASIIIELGYDYVDGDRYLKDSFIPLYNSIYTPAATTTPVTTPAVPGTTSTTPGATPATSEATKPAATPAPAPSPKPAQ